MVAVGPTPPHVAVLPTPPAGLAYVGVPPADRQAGPGIHWRVPPHWTGRYVTDADRLAEVLAPAATAVHGPTALALQCRICWDTVPRAHAVTAHGRLTAADRYPRRLTAHRACARHMVIDEEER
ncbi:hypothetical protein [Streptomyces sp. NPDC057676]|uniref:hypothetical protein n=1 Tax=Streptomyces sp. NPDC057676 TaxID=3346205 RepID=UPI0036A783D1